jgi:hypothetical protein
MFPYLLSRLDEIPYLLSRLDEEGVPERCIEQWEGMDECVCVCVCVCVTLEDLHE